MSFFPDIATKVMPYKPTAWYWAVSGNPSQVFDSGGGAFVALSDTTYQAWLAAGNLPSVINSNNALFGVLNSAGALTSGAANNLRIAGGLDARRSDLASIMATAASAGGSGAFIPSNGAVPGGGISQQIVQSSGGGVTTLPNLIGYLDNITAHAGGGQSSAVLLGGQINRVTVVGSGNDSVQLPSAYPGRRVRVLNAGANTLRVYVSNGSSDTIDGAGASYVGVSSGKGAEFECPALALWFSSTVVVAS